MSSRKSHSPETASSAWIRAYCRSSTALNTAVFQYSPVNRWMYSSRHLIKPSVLTDFHKLNRPKRARQGHEYDASFISFAETYPALLDITVKNGVHAACGVQCDVSCYRLR